jgi:hypothetical protein
VVKDSRVQVITREKREAEEREGEKKKGAAISN